MDAWLMLAGWDFGVRLQKPKSKFKIQKKNKNQLNARRR
jgi:hypothetical protein